MGDAPPKTAGKATYASTQSSTQDCRRINTAFNPPTRYHQLENGVANYGHPAHTDLIVVYFGPQTAKNRTEVLTHPTGSHQAGHYHAFSYNYNVSSQQSTMPQTCLQEPIVLLIKLFDVPQIFGNLL